MLKLCEKILIGILVVLGIAIVVLHFGKIISPVNAPCFHAICMFLLALIYLNYTRRIKGNEQKVNLFFGIVLVIFGYIDILIAFLILLFL